MKKGLYIGVILALILSSFSFASAQVLMPGSRGDEVKALQEILKEDSTIYPEGLVTGYFGNLTKGAIRRLQRKFGLPETGNLDEETQRVIFPEISVKVVSPNGGENWDRNQIHFIKWEVPAATENKEFTRVKWLWPKVSIDLFRKVENQKPTSTSGSTSIFVKHIAFVPYWKGSYAWKISRDIPNGSDYVIRITAVRRSILPCLASPQIEACLQQRLPSSQHWDESDAPFTISGEIQPYPGPDLSKAIKILEEISSKINQVISILKSISVSQ